VEKIRASKTAFWLRVAAANLVVLGFLLIVFEGFAGYALLAYDMMRYPRLRDLMHARYDPLLGWVNKPDVFIPDMYGPGVYLQTNNRGFRNRHPVDDGVPKGKKRILCSGDSFTLGYGVDNDHTWCQMLETFSPNLETVNMGQGGYGIDQAYLRYLREASRLEYQMHLFSFIVVDFFRIQSDQFFGYGKPIFDVENGKLVLKNVPVPRYAYYFPWLSFFKERIRHLSSYEILKRIFQKEASNPGNSGAPSEKEQNLKVQKIQRLIFEDLKRISEERSAKLVLVYLPTYCEIKYDEYMEWMKFIEDEARTLHIPLINVLRIFRSMPLEEAAKMFTPQEGSGCECCRHLSNQGNEFVARLIYEKIKKDPELSGVLSLNRPTQNGH